MPFVEPVTMATLPVRSNSAAGPGTFTISPDSGVLACGEGVAHASEALGHVGAEERGAGRRVELGQRVPVEIDGVAVAFAVRVVGREHEHLGNLSERCGDRVPCHRVR